MIESLAPIPFQTFYQLFLAIVLGALLGLERQYKGRGAGLRTYSLVSLGSTLFTIVGLEIFESFRGIEGVGFDPGRVVNSIAIGIGFLGAGTIIHRGAHVAGLTTAAGLWVSGAIGMAVGGTFYWEAIFGTFLALLVLAGLHRFEWQVLKKGEHLAEEKE